MGMGWSVAIQYCNILPIRHFQVCYYIHLDGKAWLNLFENKTAFTRKKDYEKQKEREREREAQKHFTVGSQKKLLYRIV